MKMRPPGSHAIRSDLSTGTITPRVISPALHDASSSDGVLERMAAIERALELTSMENVRVHAELQRLRENRMEDTLPPAYPSNNSNTQGSHLPTY